MCKAIFIDLSGTIHIGSKLLDGVSVALDKLRLTIPILFVSNTTKKTAIQLSAELSNLGLNINSREIFTSLSAIKQLVKDRGLRPLMFLDKQAHTEFIGMDYGSPSESFSGADSVIVALSPDQFNYSCLNEAFLILKTKPNTTFITAHMGRYQMGLANQLELGPGAFVKALEYSSGLKAEVIGKPSKEFFESACRKIEELYPDCLPANSIKLSDILMIGDDACDDVLGALFNGIGKAALVKTGKYMDGDEIEVLQNGGQLFDSFAHFVTVYLESLPSQFLIPTSPNLQFS